MQPHLSATFVLQWYFSVLVLLVLSAHIEFPCVGLVFSDMCRATKFSSIIALFNFHQRHDQTLLSLPPFIQQVFFRVMVSIQYIEYITHTCSYFCTNTNDIIHNSVYYIMIKQLCSTTIARQPLSCDLSYINTTTI